MRPTQLEFVSWALLRLQGILDSQRLTYSWRLMSQSQSETAAQASMPSPPDTSTPSPATTLGSWQGNQAKGETAGARERLFCTCGLRAA